MDDLDLSYVTFTDYDDDGQLGCQCDAYAEEGHGITPFHTLQPLGLHARPSDPEGERGALCWRWTEGSDGFCIPFGDVRVEGTLPDLTKGATCVHDTVTGEHRLTLDAKNKLARLEVPSGSKIQLDIGGQLKLVMDGTTIKITGATSVECGGAEALAKHAAAADAFTKLAQAVTQIGGSLTPPAAATAAQPFSAAATAAAAAFASAGQTTITKGA